MLRLLVMELSFFSYSPRFVGITIIIYTVASIIIIIILISSPGSRAQHCNYATLLASRTVASSSSIITIR